MRKILGIGELVWDVFPAGKQLGGAPVNFAYFAKELGAEAYPVAALGCDELGDEAMEVVRPSGLKLDYIQRNSLPTSRVLVTTDEQGIPQYEIVENVAWDAIECNEAILELASQADVICWGSLAQRSEISRKSILAIVDADLMATMPAGLTAATGMDALTHAIEGYIGKRHTCNVLTKSHLLSCVHIATIECSIS